MRATRKNIDLIVEELRRGAQVRVGGSRYHEYYGYKEETWFRGIFDEGYRTENALTEEMMMTIIKEEFSSFKGLLKSSHVRIIGEALQKGDAPLALKHLLQWEKIGDPYQEASIIRAYLQWPDIMPSAETRKLIQEKISGYTAYHVLMGFLGFEETEENGLLGLRYLSVLIEITGEVPRWRRLRATFREMSGDIKGALEDTQYCLDNLSADYEFSREDIERKIEALQSTLED